MIELHHEKGTILFSGDLGRPNSVSLYDPARVAKADYLILESTYGNRKHDTKSPADALSDIIGRTAAQGGTVLIPAFTVGRTQELLIHLYQIKQLKRIPDLPIFLDSPMAIDASNIFRSRAADHRLNMAEAGAALAVATPVHMREDSQSLDVANRMPKVIISASGMATGGRVLHHLKTYAPDARNTILFVGFQAAGTRGAAMVSGTDAIKIHGSYVPVRAAVEILHALSAHADADEILEWLRNFTSPPKMTFLTHGEPDASDTLRRRITETLGWACAVPEFRDEAILYE